MKIAAVSVLILFLVPAIALPQYDVTVEEITVWLHVLDSDGKPVEDLTRDEIEIYEDGKPQNLTCFEKTSPQDSISPVEVDRAPDTPPTPGRRIVLFLDLLNTSPSEYLRVRPQMEEFLHQIAGKNWEVMLAAITQTGRLGVIAPFTVDLNVIRDLLRKAPANGKRDAEEKKNIREIAFLLDRAKKDPAMEPAYVERATALATNFAREEERNSELSVNALESFAGHLFKQRSSAAEHTIMLYLSGGFHADPGRRYHEMIAAFQEKRHGTSSSGSLRETSFDIRRLVKKSVGRLNRMNITLYTINTRGMYDGSDSLDAADPSLVSLGNTFLQDYQESLAQIADETGGLFFKNSHNFKKGFDLVLNDLSVTYELCYRPPARQAGGKYHEIRVKVKRKNVDVRHRRGYVD